MKKTLHSKSTKKMRPEYEFDYGKGRPNRFAGMANDDQLVVILDKDISQVFTTPESVKIGLRALITSMPKIKAQKDRKSLIKPRQKKIA